jgi:hypothetical protein
MAIILNTEPIYIPKNTLDFVLTWEGLPDFGINDKLLGEYEAKYGKFKEETKQQYKAEKVYDWAYKKYGFLNYNDPDVAAFLFDTFVHLKTIYFVLVANMTGKNSEIAEILDLLNIDRYDKHKEIYTIINTFCSNADNKKSFIAQCMFYRRRMERCYPKWCNKSNKEQYYKYFDDRIAMFPFELDCVPKQYEDMQNYAANMCAVIAKYGAWKSDERTKYTTLTDFVYGNIGYNLEKVKTGIWGVPRIVLIEDCLRQNNVQRVQENTTQISTPIKIIAAIALTKLLKLW